LTIWPRQAPDSAWPLWNRHHFVSPGRAGSSSSSPGRPRNSVRQSPAAPRPSQRALGLKETEWALTSVFFTYALPDFKCLPHAAGPRPTRRGEVDDGLLRYCGFFLRVFAEVFGSEQQFVATIFREDGTEQLAVRLVAIHLKPIGSDRIGCETITSSALSERLQELERILHTASRTEEEISSQRIVRVYSEYRHGRRSVPTLFLVKSDQARY
jgi:hypothetical protein